MGDIFDTFQLAKVEKLLGENNELLKQQIELLKQLVEKQ